MMLVASPASDAYQSVNTDPREKGGVLKTSPVGFLARSIASAVKRVHLSAVNGTFSAKTKYVSVNDDNDKSLE